MLSSNIEIEATKRVADDVDGSRVMSAGEINRASH
jgi:hypothetical protein